jgi:Kef-type K+ transport system membrane component KefB
MNRTSYALVAASVIVSLFLVAGFAGWPLGSLWSGQAGTFLLYAAGGVLAVLIVAIIDRLGYGIASPLGRAIHGIAWRAPRSRFEGAASAVFAWNAQPRRGLRRHPHVGNVRAAAQVQ